jgi:hypothetical protein
MFDAAVRVVVRVLDHRQKITAAANYYRNRRFSANSFMTDHVRQGGRNSHRLFSWHWPSLTLRLTHLIASGWAWSVALRLRLDEAAAVAVDNSAMLQTKMRAGGTSGDIRVKSRGCD